MILRVARHTAQLVEMTRFYTEVLGFECLGAFKNHAGYDGVMLGHKGLGWHLEFTQNERTVKHRTDPDDFLVFYTATLEDYHEILERLKKHKIRQIQPENPYWLENGIVINDPDQFKVVISQVMIRL